MKKSIVVLTLFLSFFTAKTFGDIVLVSPKINVQVCIDNVDAFPEIVVVGVYETLFNLPTLDAKRIIQNTDLQLDRTHPLSIYAVQKDYFKKVRIDKLDLNNKNQVSLIVEGMRFQEIDDQKYLSVTTYYSIQKEANSYRLVRNKTVYKFKNGKPDVITKHK